MNLLAKQNTSYSAVENYRLHLLRLILDMKRRKQVLRDSGVEANHGWIDHVLAEITRQQRTLMIWYVAAMTLKDEHLASD